MFGLLRKGATITVALFFYLCCKLSDMKIKIIKDVYSGSGWRKEGDIIEMDPDLITKTHLRVEGRTCFTGEIGLEGDQVAFQVNESISEAVKLIGKKNG